MIDYSAHTDAKLADLLRAGDHRAYTEIYDRYNGLLYVFAYKRLRDREEAKDIIHELFLAIWTNHESLELNQSLAAYLYSSVRNRIINIVVHQKIAKRYIDSFQYYIENNTDHLVRH